MIGRHFAAGLRRQDWAAVAVELLVVIVGVFIGLQVDNWNQDRQTDARSAALTARLKSDLREEAWNWESQIAYYTQVENNAKRAADALTGKAPLSDEALLIAAYRASQFYVGPHRRATYDELTSTGEMGLIRDPRLRDLASRLYTTRVLNWIPDDGRASAYRRDFRMALPQAVQQALAQRCGDSIPKVLNHQTLWHELDYPCTTGLNPQMIAASAAILRGDPHLLALLRLQIANTQTSLNYLTTVFDQDISTPLLRFIRKKP